MKFFKLIFLTTILLVTACTKTTVTLTSNPPGAQVVFDDSGITATTDQKITLQNEYFRDNNSKPERIIFEKKGYRTQLVKTILRKGIDNVVPIDLDKLDTQLDIKSTPAAVHLMFVHKNSKNLSEAEIKRFLPESWPVKFTTPIYLECTQDELQLIMANLKLKMKGSSGYVPTGEYWKLATQGIDLNLKTDYSNQINISLKPVVTTLQVVSTPPGAIVEDISSGGFGYIGETPVIRNFNWEDVVQWSEKRRYRESEAGSPTRKKTSERLIYLDLRISKPGYEDAFLRGLRIPIGEERSFHKNMKERISTINFASDPAGVHVYVERENIKEVYDVASKSFVQVPVIHKKHLGTTPFTLNMDPNDPLRHGEKLIFDKTGYIPGSMDFSEGNDSYYEVMRPMEVRKR